MNKLEGLILSDLYNRALKAGKFVRIVRHEKHYFETFYAPVYLSYNFEEYGIDEISTACSNLSNEGYIEFVPGAYLRLTRNGVEYIEKDRFE